MRESAPHNPDLPLDEIEERMALVQRIAHSSKLARSARLRELLLFISKRTLKERCERLTEQEIGTDVFGRELGYDTNVDNIVRVNVSELRKRIETYFASEGALESTVMEIPRGTYIPVFRRRRLEPEAAPAEDHPKPILTEASPVTDPVLEMGRAGLGRRGLRFLLLSGTAALLACGCFGLFLQKRTLNRELSPVEYQPELKAFWAPFLDSSLDTDIVLPDASFGQFQLLSGTRVSLQDYISRNYVNKPENDAQDPVRKAMLINFASKSLVTPSSFRLAEGIRALNRRNTRIHVYLSEEFRATSVESDNLILIGVPFANPWMQIFQDRLNFVASDVDRHFMILNRAPQNSENATYPESPAEGYCAIAYLPNPGHKGKVLLIQGTNPAAFEAGRFFILSDAKLGGFRQLLRVNKLPYLEVLLRVPTVRGTPMNATVVAFRSYPDLAGN